MDKRHAYLFVKFLETEMKKIDEDKFFEGLRISADPGQSFIVDWINRNAKNWREEWESSCCQHCVFWKVCGHRVLQKCKEFKLDPKEQDNDG